MKHFLTGLSGPMFVDDDKTFGGMDSPISYTPSGQVQFVQVDAPEAAGYTSYISDPDSGFLDAGFDDEKATSPEMIEVSGSANNDGFYQVVFVEADKLHLHQNYSLTNETAGAGDVTIGTVAMSDFKMAGTHNRKHDIDSGADHASPGGTEDNLVDFDGDGFPVGDSGIAGSDISDAVSKKHSQNTDTALGIQSQALDMGSHKIENVTDPSSDQDAATKKYVDDNDQTLFEVDVNGGLMPVTDTQIDANFELDGNDDIQPQAA